MADRRIDQLDAASALDGTEPVPVYQDGEAKQTTAQAIADLAPVESVAGRTGAVVLSDTDVPAEVVNVSGTSKTLALSDRGQWQDWTNTAAKDLTVNTDVGASPGEYHIHNAADSGDLTITVTGVTITPPLGGTLVIPPGGVCTLKWRATNSFKLFGESTAA